MLLSASPALAATTPATAITNDPNAANGNIAFFDASGNRITSGTNIHHVFDYASATTDGRTGTNKATVYFAAPDHNQPDSSNWNFNQVTASTNFPVTTAPAPVKNITHPVATAGAADADLQSTLNLPQDTTAGYAGIIQVRLFDTGPGISQDTVFWASDIYVDTTAGTWQQVFPNSTATSISAPSATPASPAPSGTTSVSLSSTLTAADGSHPTGSVELFNGTTDLGAATFNASTGAISKSATVTDGGSYNFKFVFTPTDPTGAVLGSSSAPLAYSVKGAAAATSTVLSGPTSTQLGTAVTIHADVKTGSPAAAVPAGSGKVQFLVDGTASGAAITVTATGADFQFNPAAAGSNTITATFTSNDTTVYLNSSDTTGVTVTTTAPQYAPAQQNVDVTVPAGTLVISTPYTVSNPFKLGTMVLDASGTQFTASAAFGDPAAPATTNPTTASNGVTITDTRAGSTGWTASAQTTDFTGSAATVINGDNLTFSSVTPKYLTGNKLQTGSVSTNSISAFKSAKKSFATTTQGPGTVNITGVLGLTAPTSTLAGDYTATLTFTIA
jgi:hypothetical protein